MSGKLAAFIATALMLLTITLHAATPQDEQWVRQRVATCKMQPNEHPYDDIAWVPTLGEALRLSRTENRPVFLFCTNGDLCTGRL